MLVIIVLARVGSWAQATNLKQTNLLRTNKFNRLLKTGGGGDAKLPNGKCVKLDHVFVFLLYD